ncbi:MAG: T9SS type A sorting domain-containing protein, partial [Saprospiraceae bacterium]
CDQLITILPLVLDSVDCPPAFIGACGDSTDPSNTGWPSVNGTPITDDNNVCNIFVGFWDHELNDCGNGVKIVRTWTILDWCTQTTLECVQVIKLSDNQAPVISCPSNITVGTAFWYCYGSVSVPKPNVTDACGSAFTLSLSSTGGTIVNFGNNYVLNQVPIGTVKVTWTATDECGNSSTCSFNVTVKDDVVPVALCDEHTVVALTNDGPFGITLVPAKVFDDGSYDACGPVTFRARRMDSCIDFDWTTDGACIDDIPGGIPPVNSRDKGTVSRPCVPFACCDVGAGPIMVELEVTDAAGNRNFCMVEAIVQDKISPFVQCPPDITISCDFWFNVQEGTFVDANGNNNGNLDEDPLSAIFGNVFDAFRYNDDESVRQDIIINDPGNPNVSHPHFWGIDGWADDNCEVNLQVRVRVVNDCSGDALPPGAPAGAVKLIERRFSASDGNQGIAPGTCTQRIWVVDFDPFFITDVTCGLYNNDDVVWPCDVLLTSCPEDLGDTGEPIVFDDACSLIGIAYEDQRFDFVDGACFKILRTWSVIDWCQYNPLTGEGLWHYIQVIKVHDNQGPEFLNCPTGPVTLCVADQGVTLPANNQVFLGHNNPLSSSCSVHLNLCQAVHETCSDVVNYDVKLFLNNGDEFIYVKPLTSITTDSSHNANLCFDTHTNASQIIRNNGIPYNSPFCGDYHRLLWSAEDGCGNWSHCEYLIRLEDCKQPSPVCINGLSTVVMPFGGQVTIWARDFNASSFDDCTPDSSLLYSFSGETYTPSFTYTCDNVPAFGVELSVNIWVADGGTDDNCNNQISWSERNKDFCTTTIVITDNVGACPDTTGSVLIAGEVLTEDVQSVEKVAVTLTSPGHVFPTYVTVQDGKYNFSNIIVPENYTISADRNDAFRNGVSTLDLVRIQKHLLGIEPLSSPYDLIAADANNSQSVSAIDLVELRKLILGIYTELPANKSWRFVDKSFQFADPTHPWPFTESISVSLNSNQYDKDFVAIKVGDVNNTVQANATQVLPRSEKGVVKFIANDRIVTTGEMVDVAISSVDFAAIEGYQFTLQTQGLEFRGVEAGIINMGDENMGVFGSTLTASWHKVGGVSATASDVLFTLKFQATAPGKLSTMLALNSKETQAEAYNTLDDIKGLKLTFRGAEHGAEFALYQNEPNPFKGNTVIGYDLPQAGKVTLTLFDVTGKVLLVKDQDSVKGYNTISVSSKVIPSVGVLYYRLDANEYTATKKMIIIE